MNNPDKTQATLLMTTSLKGGTGKSLFACTLLDNLRSRGHHVAAYDGDGVIGTLSAMHALRNDAGRVVAPQDPIAGVVAYNVRDDSRNMLIDSAEQFSGLILHDLAGGALADLQRIFDDQGGLQNLFNTFKDMQIRPVFLHIITADKATVQSVATHMDMTEQLGDVGGIACHIAVLNRRGILKPADYPFWYGYKDADGQPQAGKTRERLLALGGIEIVLPHIDERTLALAKNLNIPLSAAIHDRQLPVVDRQRIRTFVTAFDDAMTPEVRAILGVEHA